MPVSILGRSRCRPPRIERPADGAAYIKFQSSAGHDAGRHVIAWRELVLSYWMFQSSPVTMPAATRPAPVVTSLCSMFQSSAGHDAGRHPTAGAGTACSRGFNPRPVTMPAATAAGIHDRRRAEVSILGRSRCRPPPSLAAPAPTGLTSEFQSSAGHDAGRHGSEPATP